MDLQTERRLEQFFHLSNLSCALITARIEFSIIPFLAYIEYIDEHVPFPMSVKIVSVHSTEILLTLLSQCHPARLQGVPIRAYILNELQFPTCSPAPDGDVKHWLICWKTILPMLEKLEKFAEVGR